MFGAPFSETLVGRLAGYPEESLALVDLCHVLIADAEREPTATRAESLRQVVADLGIAPDEDPADALAALAAEVTHDWAETWFLASLAIVAVNHPWYDIGDLSGGSLHRRIDAIYDMFDTDFCAHEVQARYLELLGGLVEAAESGTTTALKSLASVGLGAAGGIATAHGVVTAMSWAQRASSWLEEQGKRPTSDTAALAEVLLVWSLLPGADDGLTASEAAMVKRAQAEFRDVLEQHPSDASRLRMWRATLELMQAEVHEGVAMPNYVGMTLDRARDRAGDLGLKVTTVDGARRGSDSRIPWLEANWRVAFQFPPAEAAIPNADLVLVVTKASEELLTAVESFAEAKHRAVSLGI